ncbi:matrix metalloproteinase-18-like isoform X3 [Pyxicephalus adspersus]|uniref:matrix metalloproteinase-18-like isoform X3 n=1 Tax=Pyxicephalus adspersus TaxID=30357 RepID=UPI003B597394
MAKQTLLQSVGIALLLILPLGLLRPISEDTETEDNRKTLSAEINTLSVLQPSERNLEMPAEINTEQFKLAAEYLIEFGYLPDENLTDYAVPDSQFISEHLLPEEFIGGLEWFQRQNGLKVTGKLDEETTETMKLPRCGKHEHRMSYKLGAKWKTDMLTYKIINTTSQLPSKLVRDELKKALKVWETVSPLTFVEVNVNQTADIDIFFVSGLHNDGESNAFDGPGRILGHAFMPPFSKNKKSIDGDLHLDNDEKWTINEKKGEYFWDLSHGKLPMGSKKKYPQMISSKWKELPAFIDAAVRLQNPVANKDGKLFFFKGAKYWKYENDQIESSYPKLIKEGFPGIPNNIDAAFTQPAIVSKRGNVIREERIFFIKGKKYYLYDPVSGNSTSPESMEEDWVGVKLPITAALSFKNEMYLIGKKKFQKILMLTYSQNRVYGNIHQAKNLDQLLLCDSPKP